MAVQFMLTVHRVGIATSLGALVVALACEVTPGAGFASLKSRDDAIGDPMFTLMEMRNIGVAGYLGVFLLVTVLLAPLFLFKPAAPATAANSQRSRYVA
jgi:hypothetical protein